MEVPQRGRKIRVPHQTLQRDEVHAAFESMGREAVSQGMRRRGLGQSRSTVCDLEGPLNGARTPRFPLGIREQIRWGAMVFPVRAKLFEQDRADRHGPIFVAFAAANPQEHALGIDVGDLQMQEFFDAKSAGVGGAKHRTFGGIAFGLEELFDFAGAEDGGQRLGFFGEAHEGNVFGCPLEDLGVEESHGTGDLVEGAPRNVLCDEVQLECANRFRVESVE